MSKIKCLMLEPTTLVRDELRRWAVGSRDSHCHDASSVVYMSREKLPDDISRCDTEDVDRSNLLWPKTCSCGYEFADSDHWQVCITQLYCCPDGALVILNEAPPGAMWFADWMAELGIEGPDGHVLVVALPPKGGLNDVWVIDQKSQNGSGWTRTGVPPTVTVTPSILTPRYHGFLRDGYLDSV